MPQKRERNLPEDVDNIKTRKTLRQPAEWSIRFWAWLVDVVVLGVVIAIVFPSALTAPLGLDVYRASVSLLIFILYWTLLESGGRQTLGKRALDLKLATLDGDDVGLGGAFVNAFGKALLLPIDLVIGVLAKPGQKQRLFNIASDTVVVKA